MKKITKKDAPHLIDKIMVDFAYYIDPQLLKAEFHDALNPKSANVEMVKKYRDFLSNIRYAWQKILKYEKYFTVFYAPEHIENIEALNHHIHAYLQDMDTLKNKIKTFLGVLKKDLKKVVSNKEEAIKVLNKLLEKTDQTFEGVLKYRRPHVHDGTRFVDGDLLKAENAQNSLALFSNPLFDAMLNQEYKPKLFAKFEKEKSESFAVAKNRWAKMAENNNHQTNGYLEMILGAVQPSMYRLLNIKSVTETINGVHNEN